MRAFDTTHCGVYNGRSIVICVLLLPEVKEGFGLESWKKAV
jgi:hypothetical protein